VTSSWFLIPQQINIVLADAVFCIVWLNKCKWHEGWDVCWILNWKVCWRKQLWPI